MAPGQFYRNPLGDRQAGRKGDTEMQPETIRRTVSFFEEQPQKAMSTPTVEAHAEGGQRPPWNQGLFRGARTFPSR
jgi:hypothetical protein